MDIDHLEGACRGDQISCENVSHTTLYSDTHNAMWLHRLRELYAPKCCRGLRRCEIKNIEAIWKISANIQTLVGKRQLRFRSLQIYRGEQSWVRRTTDINNLQSRGKPCDVYSLSKDSNIKWDIGRGDAAHNDQKLHRRHLRKSGCGYCDANLDVPRLCILQHPQAKANLTLGVGRLNPHRPLLRRCPLRIQHGHGGV